jgi:hypothetical protein
MTAPLCKFAIFVCGGLPLYYLADQGYEISAAAMLYDKLSGQALQLQASYEAMVQDGNQRWSNSICETHFSDDVTAVNSEAEARAVFGLDCDQIVPELMIQIPTVHVYGSRDPRMGSALQLAQFCKASRRKSFDHGGGHDIPRTTVVSKKIAELLLWAIGEAT